MSGLGELVGIDGAEKEEERERKRGVTVVDKARQPSRVQYMPLGCVCMKKMYFSRLDSHVY